MATAGMKCIRDKMIIFVEKCIQNVKNFWRGGFGLGQLYWQHFQSLKVTLADFCQVCMRLVCTQLLSNEWSHESVVLLGSSLFVLT
jgi:hypothetical protein